MRVMGLISGTSVDGIDGAIADIQGYGDRLTVTVVGGATRPYPASLQGAILAACAGEPLTLETLATLDDQVAQAFAQAAQALIAQYGPVDLIASHGQTVFHRPPMLNPGEGTLGLGYSLQLGRGEAIATLTHCPTISNFRAADIAAGGQGAPLVPPVDRVLFSHPHHGRCVQNLGGIGNLTYLPPRPLDLPASDPDEPPSTPVLGWDTGPGNSLLDLAVQDLSQGQLTFDTHGQWAAQGQADVALVAQWLQAPYFQQAPPKSTGRELFGWGFWQRWHPVMVAKALGPADILATLTEFTAAAIAQEYHRWLPALPQEVLLCGGGSHNHTLCQRLTHYLPHCTLAPLEDFGIPSDLKEAIAFAILGFWRYQGYPGNLPSVTGAFTPALLGELHHPPRNTPEPLCSNRN